MPVVEIVSATELVPSAERASQLKFSSRQGVGSRLWFLAELRIADDDRNAVCQTEQSQRMPRVSGGHRDPLAG